MDFAAERWWKSGRRRVGFSWNGLALTVHATSFRLLVTYRGQPVACRWH
jgi:hypothetical protein